MKIQLHLHTINGHYPNVAQQSSDIEFNSIPSWFQLSYFLYAVIVPSTRRINADSFPCSQSFNCRHHHAAVLPI